MLLEGEYITFAAAAIASHVLITFRTGGFRPTVGVDLWDAKPEA